MIYIQQADLIADSYERFITESTADTPAVIDNIEKKAIDLVKTYLQGRYDTDKIFSIATPIRNELLVDIIVKIMLKKIFGRNAVRKVSEDIAKNYDWAVSELSRINSGKTILHGLPVPQDDLGNPTAAIISGNLSNPDFYI